ncbi:MAG: hypothetical protein KDB00_02185 [Planctomycetales bacterium]|nr:hypothetical protein [Planctomycetales bacterium]
MIPIGPIIALVAAIVPAVLILIGLPPIKRYREWRPKRLRELNAQDSPMSIAHATATIETRLRLYWADDPANLHRLDRLLTFFDSRVSFGDWETALGDVQTWPDDLDDPIELPDRILWALQTFIDANHCAAFCGTTTKRYFLDLVDTLSDAGIEFPDAADVDFDRIQ